ncbi:MAG: hypothetical protein K2Z81_18470 [Cyanobacteria bacterium]|nr:hypothetical protein [Cyanobacteriota bacterium]
MTEGIFTNDAEIVILSRTVLVPSTTRTTGMSQIMLFQAYARMLEYKLITIHQE